MGSGPTDFDAQFAVSNQFGFNQNIVNSPVQNVGAGAGSVLQQNTDAFNATLSKTFANGGSIQFQNSEITLNVNAPGLLFPSSAYRSGESVFTPSRQAGLTSNFNANRRRGQQPVCGGHGRSRQAPIARINDDISLRL